MLLQEICRQPQVMRTLIEKYPEGLEGCIDPDKDLFLFGTGASLSACLEAKYAFLKYTGINAMVIPACEIMYYRQVLSTESQVFVVSQSGESYETRIICDQLMEIGISFYAITNNPESYLGKSANECYALMAGSELGTATKTQTASLLLLLLAACSDNAKALNQILKIPKQMEQTICKVQTYVQSLSEFLGNNKVLYITGLDAHAPTALQAGLILKEKVCLHAEGISLTEFRHGPVEALEKDTPIIIISDREKLKIAIKHADFLSNVCGAKVALVTNLPDTKLQGYPNYPFVWEGDEQLSHISATVPFQLLAYFMADQRGYSIDGFRFIGKILDSY